MDVSIIIPLYNPNKEIIKKIDKALKEQNYKGDIKIIKVNKGLGLADSLNFGIKKAKTEIVISLHQDCVPSSKDWLEKLTTPLKKQKVVASVSKVELPFQFWEKFDLLAKIMSIKEQEVITPLMDEKGCAYKKSIIKKVGFFDGKTFRTAGEDFDMWIKLKEKGEIAYPDCKIFHYHKHTFKNRIKKELQLSNGFGTLVRIYGQKMPKYWLGFLKSIPILGWVIFLINFPYLKMGFSSLFWIPLSLMNNLIYSFGFWKGFFEKKQTI